LSGCAAADDVEHGAGVGGRVVITIEPVVVTQEAVPVTAVPPGSVTTQMGVAPHVVPLELTVPNCTVHEVAVLAPPATLNRLLKPWMVPVPSHVGAVGTPPPVMASGAKICTSP
jgi:hypothetical protein